MGDNKTIRMTLLPVARIRTIMKSSPEIANINQESLFLITKATVSFQQGCRIWRAGRQNITIPGGIIILSVCLFVCFQGFSLRNSAKAIAITPSWPGITGQFQKNLRLFGNTHSHWCSFFGRYIHTITNNNYSWIFVFHGWDGARTHNLLRYPDRESDALATAPREPVCLISFSVCIVLSV